MLHENLQRESHKHNDPPASVTRLQLLREQTDTVTSNSLTVETH